jgi:hypothetical protein
MAALVSLPAGRNEPVPAILTRAGALGVRTGSPEGTVLSSMFIMILTIGLNSVHFSDITALNTVQQDSERP